MSLKGFTREMVKLVGAITLPITMGVRTHASMAITNFVVVKAHLSYNAIVGYPTLSKMRAVTLTFQSMHVSGISMSSKCWHVNALHSRTEKWLKMRV